MGRMKELYSEVMDCRQGARERGNILLALELERKEAIILAALDTLNKVDAEMRMKWPSWRGSNLQLIQWIQASLEIARLKLGGDARGEACGVEEAYLERNRS